MGNLRICLSALLLLPTLACGGDSNSGVDAKPADGKAADAKPDSRKTPDAPPPDADTFNFACIGSANPTTTTVESITVSGTADKLVGTSPGPISGLTVELFKGSGSGSAVDTELTGSDGSFQFKPQATNGSALDLFVRASGSGFRTDVVLPPAPLTKDQPGVPVFALTPSQMNQLGTFAGSAIIPGDGVLGLGIADCQGSALSGATVTVQQNGSDVGTQFDASQFLAGAFFVLNVPPAPTTITTTYDGHTFRTRTVTPIADETLTTPILP